MPSLRVLEWREFKVREGKINEEIKKKRKKNWIVKRKSQREKGSEKGWCSAFFFFYNKLAAICKVSCISADGALPTHDDDTSLMESLFFFRFLFPKSFFFPIHSFPFILSENFLQLCLFWSWSFSFSFLFELSGQFFFFSYFLLFLLLLLFCYCFFFCISSRFFSFYINFHILFGMYFYFRFVSLPLVIVLFFLSVHLPIYLFIFHHFLFHTNMLLFLFLSIPSLARISSFIRFPLWIPLYLFFNFLSFYFARFIYSGLLPSIPMPFLFSFPLY